MGTPKLIRHFRKAILVAFEANFRHTDGQTQKCWVVSIDHYAPTGELQSRVYIKSIGIYEQEYPLDAAQKFAIEISETARLPVFRRTETACSIHQHSPELICGDAYTPLGLECLERNRMADANRRNRTNS